jgi:hypothetical protein
MPPIWKDVDEMKFDVTEIEDLFENTKTQV